MKKLATVIEEHNTALQTRADEKLIVQHEQRAISEAAEMLGAIRAVGVIGKHLSSQAIRALEQFQSEKKYLAYGYERFDDFLDEHPTSPMTYRQYNDRFNALEREGDAAFDLLNDLRIPMSARKQLTAGNVEIEGYELIINGETRIAVDNRAAVLDIIKTLAAENARKDATIERGKKDVDKWKRKADEGSGGVGEKGSGGVSAYRRAFLQMVGSINALAAELGKLPAAERDELYAADNAALTENWGRMTDAYTGADGETVNYPAVEF